MTPPEPLARIVQDLLTEAFRGREAGPVWFLDDDGLLATLRGMPAEQASRGIGPEGATIAGHAEHVRWFLALLNAHARGERPAPDWSESWTVRTVDEAGWERLLSELEREYEAALEGLPRGVAGEEQALRAILATTVHVGYHVGAIRQIARCVARGRAA